MALKKGIRQLKMRNHCLRKIRHATESAARQSLRETIANGLATPGTLNAYACLACKGYHVGHTPSKVAR